MRILCKFSQNFLKDSNLGITNCKIVEIVRNSGKDPLKFEENLQNLLSSVKIRKNSPNFAKKNVRRLEKSQKSGMVQRKKCRA